MQHIGAIRIFFCLRGLTKFFIGWRDRKNCQVVVYCRGSVPKLILWNQDTFWNVMKRRANYFSKSYCWILCYVECIKESFKVDLTTISTFPMKKLQITWQTTFDRKQGPIETSIRLDDEKWHWASQSEPLSEVLTIAILLYVTSRI